MLADLEQLIELQRLEDEAAVARSRIGEIPACIDALSARIELRTGALAHAQQALEELRKDRLELEKQLAAVQARLERFRDQLMQVKTNKEYQAMQHEIAAAEDELRRLEDNILERMIEGDDLTEDIERATSRLDAEQGAVDAERAALEGERDTLETRLEQLVEERSRHVGALAPRLLSLFETIAERRNGLVVVPARDGRCSACQVRLRPQLFNDVLSNSRLIECESCGRVLYFDLQAAAAKGQSAG
ncbi:MAG: hypothetical protein F4057_00970 [Acidobacteria bacterium]|nr:hypothetical protein [Acidobacteriota bacterium]MYI73942.1 hypothetical protein [Acidobacteriota bacterium]